MADFENRYDEEEKQTSRDRITRLETSLSDFITHTDRAVTELKQTTIENQKLLTAINSRLDLLEDRFQSHVQDQVQNSRKRQWTFSIIIPAIVASLIELANALIAYGKI